MKLGPRYKLARRLGASLFDKTQTQKFALSEARHAKNEKRHKSGATSNYARQLLEKQKIRFGYGIPQRQLKRYVVEASRRVEGKEPATRLFELIELRLDNTLYRAGIGLSRRHARQLASHGHVTVNGRRVFTPSITLSNGDVVSVREGSKGKALFSEMTERLSTITPPAWLHLDPSSLTVTITGVPSPTQGDTIADLNAVIEFTSR